MSVGKKTSPRKVDLGSLARGYTEACIRRLGGFVVSPKVEPALAIRAIELMLDRGHGRVSQEHKHAGTNEDGSHQFVVRHIYEGKPKGEK